MNDNYSRTKKEFTMYVCGPTVYDYAHIGNMRPPIVFDVFYRILSLDHNVTYVQNITDIDDKIIDKALETGKTEKEISDFYLDDYLKNLKKLNIKDPTYMPRVSDNINEMVDYIDMLVKNGNAYVSNGDIYFSLNNWEKIREKYIFNLDELLVSDPSKDKKYKHDFTVWKKTNKGVNFKSPWGLGRPGWHTECSFFIYKFFGKNGIDMHGGGVDLKFPHHLNERLQYELLFGNDLAKNWIYVGHIFNDNKKMAKSVGNIITINDFLSKYSPNVLRMIFLSTSYSKPINVNNEKINEAIFQIEKIKNVILKFIIEEIKLTKKVNLKEEEDKEFIENVKANFNFPNAISYIDKQINLLNKEHNIEIFNKFLFNLDLLGFKLEINIKVDKILEILERKDYTQLDIEKINMVII